VVFMVRKKGKNSRFYNAKYGILILGMFLVVAFGAYSGFGFATFAVGDNFAFDVNWSDVKVDDTVLLENGVSTDSGTVAFDLNNQRMSFDADSSVAGYVASMDRDSVGMQHAMVESSFSNFGYIVGVGGQDVKYSINDEAGISPYDTIKSAGFIYDIYKIRFTVYVQTFSDVTNFDALISYSPEIGEDISVNSLPSSARQEILMSLDINTIVLEGALPSSVFNIKDIYLIPCEDAANQIIIAYDDEGSHTDWIYSSYTGEGNYSYDEPEMSLIDNINLIDNITTTSTAGQPNVKAKFGFDISPGAAYVDEEWILRDLYIEFEVEMELEIKHNEYEDAKLGNLLGLIDFLPRELSYGYVTENWIVFVFAIGLLVGVPLFFIIRYSRAYVKKIS